MRKNWRWTRHTGWMLPFGVAAALAVSGCVTQPVDGQSPASMGAGAPTATSGQATTPANPGNPASAASAPVSGGSEASSAREPSAGAVSAPKAALKPQPKPATVARCGPMRRDLNPAQYQSALKAKDPAQHHLFDLLMLEREGELGQRLAQGENPNVCGGPFNISLLATAAIGAHSVEAVKLLLAHGAQLEAPLGEGGESALIFAIRANHPEAAQLLIAQGANARIELAGGETALTELAKTAQDKEYSADKELALARELLALGLSPNQRDTLPERGMSPLLWAVLANKPELITLFKAHGGDASIANAKGQDALTLARVLKRDAALKALEAP